jgi:hypothetical protein
MDWSAHTACDELVQRLIAEGQFRQAVEALEQMTRITEQPEMTDADAAAVLTLVKHIQALLA